MRIEIGADDAAGAVEIWRGLFQTLGTECGWKLLFNLGRGYEKLGDPTRAIESYRAFVAAADANADATRKRQRAASPSWKRNTGRSAFFRPKPESCSCASVSVIRSCRLHRVRRTRKPPDRAVCEYLSGQKAKCERACGKAHRGRDPRRGRASASAEVGRDITVGRAEAVATRASLSNGPRGGRSRPHAGRRRRDRVFLHAPGGQAERCGRSAAEPSELRRSPRRAQQRARRVPRVAGDDRGVRCSHGSGARHPPSAERHCARPGAGIGGVRSRDLALRGKF